MDDRDDLRRNLPVENAPRLRLIISHAEQLAMECELCEELLEWQPASRWWECGCGLECTAAEARRLMEQSRDVLDDSIKNLGGRSYRRRTFRQWLADQIRPRPALPPGT